MVLMTTHPQPDFELSRPGALIAALPAVLGFIPENSLVLVSLEDGRLGSVMRVDLSEELPSRVAHLAEVAAAARPEAVIAVIVDADGAHCPRCNEEYRQLAEALAGLQITLTQDELAAIEQAAPVRAAAGERYSPLAMKHLDSELPI